MNLYTGKINEFVDWVSGVNSINGTKIQGVDDDTKISGESIRNLLQDRLKSPFYMYEDTANNRYRMFSSIDSYAIWKENPTDNLDLELFNFVRPSDYKLELTAIDSDGFNNKFVRYGDTDSVGTRIAYRWSIYNDEGESSDSLSATYTILNTSTGAITTFTRWYNRSDANPNFSIYNYLQPGENVVTIEAKGSATGARNTKTFTIVLLQINLSSTFKYYNKFYTNSPVLIPYVFERNNVSGTAKIYFRIDDGENGKQYVRDVVQDGPARINEILNILTELEEGQHVLLIWAETKYNDGNTIVNSNLLYYTFTVASSVVGSTGKFINISSSFTSGDFPLNNIMLNAVQYQSYTLRWGYYTDSLQSNTSISVTWKLLDGLDDLNPTTIATITANNQEGATPLNLIPTTYTQEGHYNYLAAYFGSTVICTIPIYITKNNKISINETGFYEMKMSAYGKTNDSIVKDQWTDVSGNVTTSFTGIEWNTNSGWYNNSFRTSGTNEHVLIDYQPFANFDFTTGKTIEIEFESEKISESTDKLIIIGNMYAARIEITPDKATLYDNSDNEVIHTNYKANERIKLAFIINNIPEESENRTVESGLVYIINNGVLERAASASGKSFTTGGPIRIGESASGVRIYSIRVYNYNISCMDEYNNYLYDSDNKTQIAENNNILDNSGNIDFLLCKNKLDTILISGNLSNILSGQTDKNSSATDVTIERFCPSDSNKNFKLVGALIRKHGQSTLNYPITSMKFWMNKSKEGSIPLYEETHQEGLLLNKNRYVMKSNDDGGKPSIPANKFVLQANYADSSGVHNGGFLRLIQETWFNAKIDNEYKLRTEPLLFSTNQLVHHNNENLNEDGTVEGYSNIGDRTRQWSSITNQEFPYNIRISPDSFPCAVFYYDEAGTKTRTFLGQYVFMDDKKSDYCYGERSIYSVPSDPFCLTNTHKNDDIAQNCVWDNKNVLRIEVVGSNVPFTSYMTHNNFNSIVEVEDETTGDITRMYNWEQAFELIYPDEDDIAKDDAKNGLTKFSSNSKYVRKVQPFLDFHEWVVSTRNNLAKFEAEAAQHLDLYKMAAYYIFVLRFGLVDSLERNAQIKTYDGVHFHYEPWDMDIALGNKNDGGIAYDPPVDRNTKLPGSITTYAISGRSADSNGNIVTSNWLWDALEAWPYWANTIVKEVADALYNAGLTYDNICSMLDEQYAAKWCEIMYNKSGYFKYIESGEGDPTWLSWLQGSRMTHRHWWLSNSMDYYDAKWFCGDYKNHYIYIRANVTEGSNQYIRITPNKQSYVSVTKDGVLQATRSVDRDHPLEFNMTIGSQTKNPIYFYGANFMEEIDLSDIAHGLDGVTLDGVYSEVLGSPLKRLNVGVNLSLGGLGYTATLASLGCQIQGNQRVFLNLQFLNIRGQLNQTDMNAFIYNNNISELKEIQAMGSGLINFYSSESGNNFTNIELPDTVYTIWMNNSKWNTMSFWHANVSNENQAEFEQVYSFSINRQNPDVGNIPTTVHNVSLLGTTGSTRQSILFVKNWINNLVSEQADLSLYTLMMDKINWSDSTVGSDNLLTYTELSYLAQLGTLSSLKGYIVLQNNGVDLTSAQLNNIKSWFGDTVFTKNSSGLVVDHKREYVQINIGGNVTVDQLGDVTLIEGNTASLNATRFSLAEDDNTQYSWSIGPVNSNDSYTRYNGLTVIQQEQSIDGIAYIKSTQSLIGHDYDVKVTCSVEGINYSTVIHVIAATYPNDMFIDVENKSSVFPRIIPGYVELYATGSSIRLFPNSNQLYTGQINNVTYTLIRQSDNTSITYIDGGSTTQLDLFIDDYITVTNDSTQGIIISANSAMPTEDSMNIYNMSIRVLFKSGYVQNASRTIVVADDVSPIVMSNQSAMYNAINNTWTSLFGSAIGRNNIFKIDLFAITSNIDFSTYYDTLSSLATANGSYLFKYLPNCIGIILDGCTLITSQNQNIAGDDKNQMNFANMRNLRKLYILNCTGLTNSIDLTYCSNIQEVDASGTTVNVLIPNNSAITKYELGTPTAVTIISPTTLTNTGVSVDDSTSITNIDIEYMASNTGFKTFAKIMNI